MRAASPYLKHNLTEEGANWFSGAGEDRGRRQALSDGPGLRISSLRPFSLVPPPALRSRRNDPILQMEKIVLRCGECLDEDVHILNCRREIKI